MRTRIYGTSGRTVALLHGGPGAPGYMAPLANELSDTFLVLEPLQRPSNDEPLTVARHVADLHELVERHSADAGPALVGHSWGAMLALAYAAAHPGRAASLVLIGCGTFDAASRDRMRAILSERLTDDLRLRIDRLADDCPDADERLTRLGKLMEPLYSHELVAVEAESETCDARAHHESWNDMMRLAETGVYPAAFGTISAPAIMLHGSVDPHPGRMIWESLKPHLPQLEYREWECCGHYPWRERAVREEFLAFLREWVTSHFAR